MLEQAGSEFKGRFAHLQALDHEPAGAAGMWLNQ